MADLGGELICNIEEGLNSFCRPLDHFICRNRFQEDSLADVDLKSLVFEQRSHALN